MGDFKMGNPMNKVATKNTLNTLAGKTHSFKGQSLGFQMKNTGSPNNYGSHSPAQMNPAPTVY